MDAAAALITRLALTPHPEGGWYREVHRSSELISTARGPRAAITSIYFLLEAKQRSRWHVVLSDELWHHVGGAPLELVTYSPQSKQIHHAVLGSPNDAREPTGVARAGLWQAARSLGAYSLLACDVGPGFDFEDFNFVAALHGHAQHFEGPLADYVDLL
ncbi:MAG TPA: cupin domain-containing protein [Steroidobacteraceae bacterium]|nr:cupin domain-containing protein [Steroidobacteraceae bacterium]